VDTTRCIVAQGFYLHNNPRNFGNTQGLQKKLGTALQSDIVFPVTAADLIAPRRG